MKSQTNPPAQENLQFFGQVVSSVSHEIKNVMAIINEKAGLLEDLAAMAKMGRPLDAARISGLADDLKRQIKRGDGIIRNMNRFAHSVDEPMAAVDISDLTGLLVGLAKRMAAQQSVTLDYHPAEQVRSVRTRPFALQLVIWNCLRAGIASCGENKSVKIRVAADGNAERIQISLQDKGLPLNTAFPSDAMSALLSELRTEIEIAATPPALVLTVPADLDSD
jgi:signal transduction histidine kinase